MESVVGRRMSRYRMWNSITALDEAYIKKFLLRSNAEDPLTLKLQKISIAEHYARLYGPTMMVKQNKGTKALVIYCGKKLKNPVKAIFTSVDLLAIFHW